MSTRPRDAENDPFHPPSMPTEVHCLHCGQEYESYLIEWREEMVDGRLSGRWCCPTPGCDGAGFGFDIFPTDPEWKDPTGELEISYDEDDGEEGDDADDDGEEAEFIAADIDSDEELLVDEDGEPLDDDELGELELEIEIEFVDDLDESMLADGDDDEDDAADTDNPKPTPGDDDIPW